MGVKNPEYLTVMEQAGFYFDGKPIPTIIEAESLEGEGQLEHHIKYRQVLSDENSRTVSIFELSGSPCIYFSQLEDAHPTAAQISQLRRSAWNRGGAPLLWIITPAEVLIYNCYSKPLEDPQLDAAANLMRLFELTANGLKLLNEFAGRVEIETGRFWQREEAKKIDRSQRVDMSLLKDLADAELELRKQRLPATIAHALLGRSIFVAYLQDRDILKPQFFRTNYSVENLAELLGSKTKTYHLFRWIRRTFNGDLFPLTRKKKSRANSGSRTLREEDRVKPDHLKIVQRLMSSTEVATGQERLWPYDFSLIPVELISSIYESFAYSGDSKVARQRSTHYTPYPLVDLVLAQVLGGVSGQTKALDMACGSGVFLVESFRRLVIKQVLAGEKLTRKLIRQTLQDQIFGIDISKEAIQIAAFSLYLTALELDPKPQPPSELKFKRLIGENLFAADAFDQQAPFNSREPFVERSFGAIVGNPPWKSGRKTDHKLLLKYCKERKYPLARNTPDQAFLWRMGDWAAEDAMIGMVLHGKPFFAPTKTAREAKKQLFRRFRPRVLINLSDLRTEKIFPHSTAPALVFIAANTTKTVQEETVAFVVPKRNTGFKKHGIIEIGPEDIKTLRLLDLESDADLMKIASWGSARDFALIRRLRSSYPTLLEFVRENGGVLGQGFQKAGGTKEASHMYGMPYLPAKELRPFEVHVANLPLFEEQGLHRPRDASIYKGPLIISGRGLTAGNFVAAFCDDDVVYPDSYLGISFPRSRVNMAHLLNGVANSTLTNYFLFLTSSVWGVERDEVKPKDVLRIPLPSYDEQHVNRIVDLEGRLRAALGSSAIRPLRNELNEAVYDLYQLDESERILVNDMVQVTVSLKTKRYASPAARKPTPKELNAYAKQSIAVIQPFLNSIDGQVISASVLEVGDAPLRVVKFTPHGAGTQTILDEPESGQELKSVLASIAHELPAKIANQIYATRLLRIYSGESLYVVKPAEYRYWTLAAALNDADAILAEHQEEDDDSDYLEPDIAGRPPRPHEAVHTA
ncbi:MAG: hypothetical protein QOE77_3304 [Blastocatellia bacterium]|jgi:hypothetical protein|nr:hypothetical protein [Blastocatellia bacterium]